MIQKVIDDDIIQEPIRDLDKPILLPVESSSKVTGIIEQGRGDVKLHKGTEMVAPGDTLTVDELIVASISTW